ncbi:hypothetical protein Tco_1136962 [Tanacetum coccineum]
MVTKSLKHAVLDKDSSQPQSSYKVVASLTEFKLKKTPIDKMDKSESYPTAPPHRECYDGLIKSYELDKSFFSTYDKDVVPMQGLKTKESKSGSSKGTKSQSKSSGKTAQVEEPEFEVADSDMPHNQEGNLGNNDEEPMREVASKSKADKPSKTFDDLMSTPIEFSAFFINGLKITNLTQETLLGPAFKLLKCIRTNFDKLEYDFEESYKALSKRLDCNNPEGVDYPFDLTKPIPLVMSGNHQKVLVNYFFNNDIKYLQGGISTMTYMTSITKTRAAQYDLPGIEDMVEVMRKHGHGYLREIEVRRADNDLYTFKEGDFPRLRINNIEDMLLLVVQNRLTNLSGNDVFDFAIAVPSLRKRDPYTPFQDPQGFIYVDNQGRNRLMRSDELYKFSDGTLTRLRSSLEDNTKNIHMEYLPKRIWSSLEKK